MAKFWLLILVMPLIFTGTLSAQKKFCFIVFDGESGLVINDATVQVTGKRNKLLIPEQGVFSTRRISARDEIHVTRNDFITKSLKRIDLAKRGDTLRVYLIPNEMEMLKRFDSVRNVILASPLSDTLYTESMQSLDALVLSQIDFCPALVYHGCESLCGWGRSFSMFFIFSIENDGSLRAKKFIPPQARNYVVEKYFENLILSFPVVVLSEKPSRSNSKSVSVPVTVRFR